MPPKKQGGKKKGLKEKKKEEEKLKISINLKELRTNYELKCAKDQSLCHPDFRNLMKKCGDEGQHLTKLILTEIPPQDGLKVKLSPAIAALRSIRYINIKDVFVWDIQVKYEDFAALSNFIQQPAYSLSYLELVDCKIDSFSLGRFKECLTACSLSALVLDFNGFGDDGCRQLCSGLEGNCKLTKLSLKFCGLTTTSGTYLGKAVSETAVSELYLDGNKLECEGLIELIKMVVDRSEQESIERKTQNEESTLSGRETGTKNFLGVTTSMSSMRVGSATSLKSATSARPTRSAASGKSTTGQKKKKRKKSPKKKAPPAPPKVGPWLTKLHVMDNGIDSHGIASKYAPVICMRLVKKWLASAADLLELDIDDNLIGDMGGREILHGLQERKEAGLQNITIWITHRMQPDTFSKILTLGTAGKKKSKKKGKPGKKRI